MPRGRASAGTAAWWASALRVGGAASLTSAREAQGTFRNNRISPINEVKINSPSKCCRSLPNLCHLLETT